METIFINEDKIKIMLTDVEMAKYCIDADFPKERMEADLIIWDILDDAAVCTGFDTKSGSFYVQMFPSKDGGCELFVTRITTETAFDNADNESVSLKKEITLTDKKCYIYKFHEFENMLGACREISIAKKVTFSAAYSNHDNTEFYLLIDADSHHPSEFGALKCKHNEIYYVTEHMTLFSDDPISKLSSLAK